MSYLSIVLGGSYSGDPSMSYWIFIGASGCMCVHVGTHGSTLFFLFKHNLLFVFSKKKIINFIFYFSPANVLQVCSPLVCSLFIMFSGSNDLMKDT